MTIPKRPFRLATDADLGRPDRRERIAEPTLLCAHCEQPIKYKGAGEEIYHWCNFCDLFNGETIEKEERNK